MFRLWQWCLVRAILPYVEKETLAHTIALKSLEDIARALGCKYIALGLTRVVVKCIKGSFGMLMVAVRACNRPSTDKSRLLAYGCLTCFMR